MLLEVNVIERDGVSYAALINYTHLVRALPTLEKSKMVPEGAMSEISLVTGETMYVKETGLEIKNRFDQTVALYRNARFS